MSVTSISNSTVQTTLSPQQLSNFRNQQRVIEEEMEKVVRIGNGRHSKEYDHLKNQQYFVKEIIRYGEQPYSIDNAVIIGNFVASLMDIQSRRL